MKGKKGQLKPPVATVPVRKRHGCLYYIGLGLLAFFALGICSAIGSIFSNDTPASPAPERAAIIEVSQETPTAAAATDTPPPAEPSPVAEIVEATATNTPAPPTATNAPPTATNAPPTSTSTPPPPTATPLPPTATIAPPPVAVPAEPQPNAFTCIGGCAISPDSSCVVKGNVNSKGELIYHMPEWRDYNRTDIKPEEGDRWFCTAQEAQDAGFRAPQNQ